MTLGDALRLELERRRPVNLLALGAIAESLVNDILGGESALISTSHDTRADLALVSNLSDVGSKTDALNLLGSLRLQAPCVLAISDEIDLLEFSDFLALGFDRLYASPAEGSLLYCHDIATYKTVPDWLNAKFWAHPERWEP
jgi:hypothetical protein